MTAKRAENQFRSFRRRLGTLAGDFLTLGVPLSMARAPGRLDVMGGVADYSGGTVLEGTLGEAALVAVQPRGDDLLVAHSYQATAHGWRTPVTLHLADLYTAGRLKSPAQLRVLFPREAHWASYVLGAFPVLARNRIVSRWPHGATLVLDSGVPMGAGVASSGAIEVATMAALLHAYDLALDGLRLARLCQQVENHVAGAPCGVMDQVTAALGEAGKLLILLCQPSQVLGLQPLPSWAATFGIDTGVKHTVGGRQYARARVGAYMGLKIITSHLAPRALGGYLCNLTPEQFRRDWWDRLPSKMTGAEFLSRYGETDDLVTTVDPAETYSVRGCTSYPIYETARVRKFVELLTQASETGDERPLVRAGRLMYAAHWGYRTLLGLGATETDLIMRLVRKRGPKHGLYGAKTSGGGSGGTMAILARADANEAVEEVADEYARRTGLQPHLFVGSSPGTLAFGLRRVNLQA